MNMKEKVVNVNVINHLATAKRSYDQPQRTPSIERNNQLDNHQHLAKRSPYRLIKREPRDDHGYLILERDVKEKINIGDDIEILILRIQNGSVSVAVRAPKELPVFRHEVWKKIKEGIEKAK
jgi:carbon storage regulator